MNSTSPLVSVCIPVYNGEAFLEETLQSLKAQTYTHWELIVVDEISEDRTREMVEEFAKQFPEGKVKLYVNEVRLRQARNMNRAMELATGEFIKILCADDVLLPDCLEVQVRALQEHPSAVLVGGSRIVTDVKGRHLFTMRPMRDGLIRGSKAIKSNLWAGTNLIGEPTVVMLRASAIKGFTLMNSEIPNCTDMDLWLRLLMHGDMVFCRKPLATFRVQGQAGTRNTEARVTSDFYKMLDIFTNELGMSISPTLRAWLKIRLPIQNALRRFIYRRYA